MNQITNFKTLIGTLYKKLQTATITGKINIKELYIINIINNLLLESSNCLDFKYIQKLQNLTIELQHLDEDICIYRETRSLYNNIIGCKNCKDINNSNIKVINTAPVINDPEPVDPTPVEPIIVKGCNATEYRIFSDLDFIIIGGNFFTKCGTTSSNLYKRIIVTKLPTKGVITYLEQPLIVGQVINFNNDFPQQFENNNLLYYTPFIERGHNEDDFLFYKVVVEDIPYTITEELNLKMTIL